MTKFSFTLLIFGGFGFVPFFVESYLLSQLFEKELLFFSNEPEEESYRIKRSNYNSQDLDSDYANENITSNSSTSQKLANPVVCVNSAIEDFKNQVRKAVPEFSNISISLRLKPINPESKFASGQLFDSYEVKSFEKFCKVYASLPPKLELCPKSRLLYVAKNVSNIVHFFCKEKFDEFKSAMPCYQKTNEAIMQKCGSECGSIATARGSLKQVKQNRNATDEYKEILRKDCNSIKCHLNCEKTVVKEKCGEKASDLLSQAVRRIFSTLIHVADLSRMKKAWPKECTQLATFP